MRPLLLFVVSLALAACVSDAEPSPLTLRPTTSHPDSLLARLDIRELEAALELLREAGYTAEVSVTQISGDTPTESFKQTIAVAGDSVRILQQSGPDSLMDRSPPFVVFDPVARLLPKEPPFRNPAMREMYAVSRGSRNGTVARASAERREGSDPVTKAEVAVDTTTGQIVSAHVWRESRSAVFRETSEATITQTLHDGIWWPSHGQLQMDIDVPLSASPRRHIEWRVLSIGGVELGADTRSTARRSAD